MTLEMTLFTFFAVLLLVLCISVTGLLLCFLYCYLKPATPEPETPMGYESGRTEQ